MYKALACVALVFLTAVSAGAAGSAMRVVTVHAPKADLQLEVAATAAQQERGLMNRTAMAPHAGMLFVFDSDAPVQFWMKNTLIPLDMIFAGADGTVRTVYRNVAVVSPALPDDAIPREAGVAKYVIELGANEAERDGIRPGVRLDIPALRAP